MCTSTYRTRNYTGCRVCTLQSDLWYEFWNLDYVANSSNVNICSDVYLYLFSTCVLILNHKQWSINGYDTVIVWKAFMLRVRWGSIHPRGLSVWSSQQVTEASSLGFLEIVKVCALTALWVSGRLASHLRRHHQRLHCAPCAQRPLMHILGLFSFQRFE